ncbi:hypothetical protein G6F40_015035 [Rhizopus arrhizus]|nr:hypothetical protein G6F40_015035 [Rhizopus arrhizus]
MAGAHFVHACQASTHRGDRTALQAYRDMAASIPGWFDGLMALRNRGMRMLGMKDLAARHLHAAGAGCRRHRAGRQRPPPARAAGPAVAGRCAGSGDGGAHPQRVRAPVHAAGSPGAPADRAAPAAEAGTRVWVGPRNAWMRRGRCRVELARLLC